MPCEKAVSDHYYHGDLLNAIKDSIAKLGKTTETVTIDDLAAVDEFHIGGREATEHFLGQIKISKQDHMLDVGCGLGGTARYIATKYKNNVTGIDLTQEYIDTGNIISSWLNLNKQVTLQLGSALSMPFEEGTFDVGFMMHVAMNIEDKEKLFKEIFRVLRPGSTFGIYDVMQINSGEINYPVPWASTISTSFVESPEHYKKTLANVGFEVSIENNRRDFSLKFFKQLQEKNAENGGLEALGLHTLMQETTAEKIKNMVDNISCELLAPIELIIKKY